VRSASFDQEYFERFYFNPRTRIAAPDTFDRIADFLAAYLRMLDCPPRRALDIGCGPGYLHPGLRRAFPQLRIEGIDVSPWACAEYGWQCVSIQDYPATRRFDLVICHDVLQYLDDDACEAALAKLARLTRVALFFSVLTAEDWEENCDQRLTDGNAHLRPAAWYRERLAPQMANAGGGLYIRRRSNVVLYALEHC